MGSFEKVLVDIRHLSHQTEGSQAPTRQKAPAVFRGQHVHLIVYKPPLEISPCHVSSSKLGLGLKWHIPEVVLYIKPCRQQAFLSKGTICP